MKILVTGVAGFIGAALTQRLLKRGDIVIGVDNLNDYYDVNLKNARLELVKHHERFTFIKQDITDKEQMNAIFASHQFDVVVNLAAQAGVRYSLENPFAYIDANLMGFANILEGCRHNKVKHLVYASSSSVYGANELQPFSEEHSVDHPVSLYAATKKSNELMAHAYAHLYQVPSTGLRFFTVYGPWGRPDMALFKFTKAILQDTPIDVYNHGNMMRDFTYVDDITGAMLRIIDKPAQPDPNWSATNPNPATSYAPYRIYNIGNNKPTALMSFIEAIESALNRKAKKNKLPLQSGDVPKTHADVALLVKDFDYCPNTPVKTGIERFIKWYLEFYG